MRARDINRDPLTPGAKGAETMIPTEEDLWQMSMVRRTGYVVLVTPALAEQWLASNTGNRKWRPGHSESLAQIMVQGAWRWTHQGIAFSKNRLIDGQHRLRAVIISGCTIPMLVFPSMDDDTFGVLDRAKHRTNKDDVKLDARLIEAASFVLRIGSGVSSGNRAVPAHLAKLASEALLPSFSALTTASNKNHKSRTASPIRAAALLRHFAASATHRSEIEAQWAAWCNLDVKAMNHSVAVLLKRLENSTVTSSGGSQQNERGACAWLGFDPANTHRKIIKLDDITRPMREMRATLDAAMDLHTEAMWEPA